MATGYIQALAQNEALHSEQQQLLRSQQQEHMKSEAMLRQLRAQEQTDLAAHQMELVRAAAEEKEMAFTLEGITALSGIMANISNTSALIAGFTSVVLVEFNTENQDNFGWMKYVLWIFLTITILVLLNGIFFATVCLSDGVDLAYHGPNGAKDVHKAFRGMLKLRPEVSSSFLSGFMLFTLCLLLVVWIKLDVESASNPVSGDGNSSSGKFTWYDTGTGIACTVVWLFALGRIAIIYTRTRALFEFTAVQDFARKEGENGLDLGPMLASRLSKPMGSNEPVRGFIEPGGSIEPKGSISSVASTKSISRTY